MSAVKEGCRKAFQMQPQRLVTPMYSCTIVVNAEVLGEYNFTFNLQFIINFSYHICVIVTHI